MFPTTQMPLKFVTVVAQVCVHLHAMVAVKEVAKRDVVAVAEVGAQEVAKRDVVVVVEVAAQEAAKQAALIAVKGVEVIVVVLAEHYVAVVAWGSVLLGV